MPTARSITPDELDRAGEIGAEAFEMPVEDWQQAFHSHYERYGADRILVVEHESELVSAMMITPEHLQMGDSVITAGAVGGVATIVKARKLGCAGAMIRETVHRMVEWGLVGSAMWPFSFAYYRKFGWELGGETRFITWPRDAQWLIRPGGDVTVVSAEDADALAAVWKGAGPGNRCSTVREPADWSNYLKPDRFGGENPSKAGLLCRRGGNPVGYMLYDIPDAVEDQEPPPVMINEFRALDGPAAIALIEGLSSRTDRAKYQAAFSMEDRLRSVAVNPRELETGVHCSFGFRIADPGAILSLMRIDSKTEPLTLRVHDELAGTHTWRITFDGQPAAKVTSEPDAECDIRPFSQIAAGFLKPVSAARSGLLTGSPQAIARLEDGTSHWHLPFRSGMEVG